MYSVRQKHPVFHYKKTEKFAGAAEFDMPKDLANKPILKQAKIIAKRFKEATI